MQLDLSDVYFLPLDMPNLELPDFSVNFSLYSTVMPEVTETNYTNGVKNNINYWDQWVAYGDGKWNETFELMYPSAVRTFKELPYEKLIRVYFFKQIRTVDPHFDFVTGLYTKYPSAMRYWVINNELDSTFYFQENEVESKKIFPRYPDDTKWWMMNSTALRHASNMPVGEKIILGIYGLPDVEKFESLLKHSMDKYSDFVLRSKAIKSLNID